MNVMCVTVEKPRQVGREQRRCEASSSVIIIIIITIIIVLIP